MSHEFLDYVEDILEEIDKAELLLANVTFEQFESDFRINYVVVRMLEIIGEAASEFRLNYASNTQRFPGAKWQGCVIVCRMGMIGLIYKSCGTW